MRVGRIFSAQEGRINPIGGVAGLEYSGVEGHPRSQRTCGDGASVRYPKWTRIVADTFIRRNSQTTATTRSAAGDIVNITSFPQHSGGDLAASQALPPEALVLP